MPGAAGFFHVSHSHGRGENEGCIECKTRQWRGKSAGTAGAQVLYRLDTLSDLLPYDRQRAADLGIAVCAGGALRNLRARLAERVA